MKKKRLEVTKSRETKERTPLAFLEDAPILVRGYLILVSQMFKLGNL